MGKESAKKIMDDIFANSPEFVAQMEAARKVETGESDKPVIVKLTGRFDNPQITNETMAEKPIDVINRLSGRDKPVPTWHSYDKLNGILNEVEAKMQSALETVFSDLDEYEITDEEKRQIIGSVEVRLDIAEEWDGWKDNQDPEIPGQDERDYPQSFLE